MNRIMRPPRGWNHWDSYGLTATEDSVRRNADAMAQWLKPSGWEYIVLDAGWHIPEPRPGNSAVPQYTLDEYGRPIPAVNKFPSAAGGAGLKPLAAYIHSLGLKFGMYMMRGMAKQAADADLPIYGTNFTTGQIANRQSACSWNNGTVGVHADRPGARQWYQALFDLFASWDIDFIKVDDITSPYHLEEAELIHEAARQTGREIVLSFSPGPAPREHKDHLVGHCDMFRVSNDLWDAWKDVVAQFGFCASWTDIIGSGCWPDADMLPLGRIGIGMGDHWQERQSRLSRDEQLSLMTLWCIARSPLMMGGDLTDLANDDWTRGLLTNADVLAMQESSSDNHELLRTDAWVVWTANRSDGAIYCALFNTGDTVQSIHLSLHELDIDTPRLARELWNQEKTVYHDAALEAFIPPHGCRLFLLTKFA